ncbi:cytochrome C assembly family protein [Escherichia coli 7-233-03_S1_C2]|nr:cytochrome C assembly family protein [Escherichia coli 7-233-03_S1_C2]
MRWPAMMRLTCIGILAQFALLLLAFGVLTYCFLISDFSVIYVAQHSYSLLSWELKLAAVWGGHEGSLLLWVLLLSAWSALFAWHYRQQTDPLFPLTLAVLSLMLAALLLFVVLWSDPFVRIFPPAIEGRDLNPMLQHPGLIFHPPLLYLGYGGLMVAASVALASLLRGEFDGACARICWRWALPGWSALTAGVILGSWGGYCELGRGGRVVLGSGGKRLFITLAFCHCAAAQFVPDTPAGDFLPLVAVAGDSYSDAVAAGHLNCPFWHSGFGSCVRAG